jgi:hypothetical protein
MDYIWNVIVDNFLDMLSVAIERHPFNRRHGSEKALEDP